VEKKHKHLKKIRIISVLFILNLVVFYTGALEYAERIAYDSRCRFSSKFITTSDLISVVVVDQDSLDWAKNEKGWSWP